MTLADIRADADDPNRMIGACTSCNSSKSGSQLLGGEGDGWDPESNPSNMRGREWF